MKKQPDKRVFEQAFVIMTALVPTQGHVDLVLFAREMADTVTVVISTRRQEPTTFFERAAAFDLYASVKVVHHHDDDAPQNEPEDLERRPEFWAYWRKVVCQHQVTQNVGRCCLVASEPYGAKLADACGYSFIPYDLERSINAVKGTDVRYDLLGSFGLIAPGFREKLITRVVLFGQESTGKTTMAKKLAHELHGYFLPEWARPYLELDAIGPDVTAEKMQTIAAAQSALEHHAARNLNDRPFQFFDTDLVSTLGYMLFWDKSFSRSDRLAVINTEMDRIVRKDLYIVMSDAIPFEADILRYGGSQRETSREFWVNLLNELGQTVHVMKSTVPSEQLAEAVSAVMGVFGRKTAAIRLFVRD